MTLNSCDEPAFPSGLDRDSVTKTNGYFLTGLTKREYFAAAALSSLIDLELGLTPTGIAMAAVKQADALIEELNRKGEQQ